MVEKTLAQQASFNSVKFVQAKDKEAWLELFDKDAILQDPVGVSPLDETGLGHKGTEAIANFWDAAIAFGEVEVDIQASHPCGYECANVAKLVKKLDEKNAITTELVIVYTVNDAGKIISLKAYWEYEKVQAQLDKIFAA